MSSFIAARFRPFLLVAFSGALLAACSSNSWVGSNDKPALTGERVPVLQKKHTLAASELLKKRPIRLPPPFLIESWPQAGGYSHHAMQHMVFAPPSEIKKIWQTSIGSGSSSRNRLLGEPIIAEDMVFAVDVDAVVSAFDLDDGSLIWQKRTSPLRGAGNALKGGGLGYSGGTIFLTAGFAQVVALNAKTGEEIWRQSIGGPMRAAPTIDGGRVFVVTIDNKAMALDEKDGRILWTFNDQEQPTSVLTKAAPAAFQGIVVVPFSSGDVVALRANNGAELWRDGILAVSRTDAVGILADIGAHPVIDRNRLFVGSHSGLLAAIDMRSGERAWEQAVSSLDTLWIAADTLYVVNMDRQLVALDAPSGQVLWIADLDRLLGKDEHDASSDAVAWTGPLLAADRLIVAGSNAQALFIDPYDGHLLDTLPLPGPVLLPPAVAKKTLVFLTEDGVLAAYR